MVQPFREQFHARFKPSDYRGLFARMDAITRSQVPFRISATPCSSLGRSLVAATLMWTWCGIAGHPGFSPASASFALSSRRRPSISLDDGCQRGRRMLRPFYSFAGRRIRFAQADTKLDLISRPDQPKYLVQERFRDIRLSTPRTAQAGAPVPLAEGEEVGSHNPPSLHGPGFDDGGGAESRAARGLGASTGSPA